MMGQLLDVVHQTVELPLRIDLLLASQSEAVQLFVVPEIPEHGFDCGKTSSVFDPTFRAVDTRFHFVGEAGLAVSLTLKECHLPGPGFFRGAQALVPLCARYAVLLRPLKLDGVVAVDHAVTAVAVQRLARRADAGVRVRVVVKVFGSIGGCLFFGFLLA